MREMVSHGGWLTKQRGKKKKKTRGASPTFFILFLILLC
jgi:hypothetical protein